MKNAKAKEMNKTKRLVIILTAVLVGLAIIFGAVLGIILGMRERSYVMLYENVGINEGVTNYLCSNYKTLYMKQLASGGVSAEDSEAFWNTVVYGENTYGSYLKFAAESYLKQLIAANVIFDKYTTLSGSDKENLAIAIDEILSYRSGGSVSEFNSATEQYGFDFDDFEDATEMLYKAWAAKTKIFGAEGENMAAFPEYLEEYYTAYTNAKLIFIRTEDTFATDAEGNRIKDDKGNDTLRPLTESERAEREGYIARLDSCIEGIMAGSTDREQFDALAAELLKKYDEFDSSMADGCYFNSASAYTKEFAKVFPDVVSNAVMLYEGECCKVKINTSDEKEEEESTDADDEAGSFVGICYILADERAAGAYSDTAEGGFFSDFYSLAATYVYQKMIDEYSELIEVREKWGKTEPALIPYNTDYVARF